MYFKLLLESVTIKLWASRKHFWGTLVQSADAASLHLGTTLRVLLWMELSGIFFLGVYDVKKNMKIRNSRHEKKKMVLV